ncbi:MAG TPA: hypothetical protein VF929_01800 [Gemmatimonadaceae bacterium]
MMLRTVFLTIACTAGLAGVARAQKGGDDIPKSYRPPPGMCRIWLDKVPPKQQPAPTDCPTAVKNKPPNGRVIFGDDYVEKGKRPEDKELPFLKKFGEDRSKPQD